MNWRCPKQVPHYPPGFSFYLKNLTIFANLFVQCEKFCNIFQKKNQKWSNFTLSKLIFQNFPIFGSKNNKIVKIKNHGYTYVSQGFVFSSSLNLTII